MKTKTTLLRLTEEENSLLSAKSILLNTDKSKLLRDGAFSYWNNSEPNAPLLLKLYQKGNEEEKKQIVNLIFEYYRRKGYPYHKLSASSLQKQMQSIANTKSPLLEGDHLQTNTVGLAMANSFHPQMMKVRCQKGYLSPHEVFANDERFKDAINRWMELDKIPSPSGLRRILRTRDGARSVVNFKPAIAKYIYDHYCPQNGNTLDPCAGYGGRLAGCIASNKNITYHGIDPDGPTATGNMKMASFYKNMYLKGIETERIWKFNFKFDLGCAEDIMSTLKNEYDLIFTSPPYHNVEQYSNEPIQSYLKFPTYEEWKEKFLFIIIEQSHRLLKDRGYFILNVKNYKKMPIADETIIFAEKIGFKLAKRYKMRLSNSEYHRHEEKPKFHTEPIFVYIK